MPGTDTQSSFKMPSEKNICGDRCWGISPLDKGHYISGLPMYDAPNAVEKLKQPRKHPTPEKVEAIKDALRYFEII